LLERLLREHLHTDLADILSTCGVEMRCSCSIGVTNSFTGSKRTKSIEDKVCTTFLQDNLLETLRFIDTNEVSFILSLPPRLGPPVVVSATQRLMQAATRADLPLRVSHRRMHGDHHLYNCIVDYLRDEGVGWTPVHMPSGKEFLDHVTRAFWVLTHKVWQARVVLIWIRIFI
jgi:hypothetical protein